MWKKWALYVLAALFTMEFIVPFSHATGQNSATFQDVPTNAYYADAVSWAVTAGITKGSGVNTFSPLQLCTRAQVLTFLWRAMGSPDFKEFDAFHDVPSDAYFAKAVVWAVNEGITKGTSANMFSPHRVCSHAQILTFLWRTTGQPSGVETKGDVSKFQSHWAYEALLWAKNCGLLQEAAVTFHPDNSCSRSDAVFYLYLYHNYAHDNHTVAFPSVYGETNAEEQILSHASSDEDFLNQTAELLKTYGSETPDMDGNNPYVTGRLIVQSEAELPSLEEYHPLKILENQDKTYYIIQFAGSVDAQKCAEFLQTLDCVKYAEPDRAMSLSLQITGVGTM